MKRKWFLVAVFAILSLQISSLQAQSLSASEQEKISTEVMAVLDEFMTQFNALNIDAWEATFQFPHYRLASGKMNVLEQPSGRTAQQLKISLGSEWHHSAWIQRNIVHLSKNKVHVDTRFARYRADNSIIAEYNSLYIVTLENGRWGIKLRSSMAP